MSARVLRPAQDQVVIPVNAVGMKLNSIRLHGDLINVTGLGGEDLGVWHLM